METHVINADVGARLPSKINLSDIFFRDDREDRPWGGEMPTCDPDFPAPVDSQDPPIPVEDADTPSYADLGGDEIKDDYPQPEDQSSGEPPQSYPQGG